MACAGLERAPDGVFRCAYCDPANECHVTGDAPAPFSCGHCGRRYCERAFGENGQKAPEEGATLWRCFHCEDNSGLDSILEDAGADPAPLSNAFRARRGDAAARDAEWSRRRHGLRRGVVATPPQLATRSSRRSPEWSPRRSARFAYSVWSRRARARRGPRKSTQRSGRSAGSHATRTIGRSSWRASGEPEKKPDVITCTEHTTSSTDFTTG